MILIAYTLTLRGKPVYDELSVAVYMKRVGWPSTIAGSIHVVIESPRPLSLSKAYPMIEQPPPSSLGRSHDKVKLVAMIDSKPDYSMPDGALQET